MSAYFCLVTAVRGTNKLLGGTLHSSHTSSPMSLLVKGLFN